MPCIEHNQQVGKSVYGTVHHKGTAVLAHRLAYVAAHGLTLEDIQGIVIRHTCDNPRCINAEHLVPGTQADNMQDCVKRGRLSQHLPPVRTGEEHPAAVLSDEDVAAMRVLYQDGLKRKELQMLFHVSKSTVQRIVTGSAR